MGNPFVDMFGPRQMQAQPIQQLMPQNNAPNLGPIKNIMHM